MPDVLLRRTQHFLVYLRSFVMNGTPDNKFASRGSDDKGSEIVEEITTEAVTWSSILYEPSLIVLILIALIAAASGIWYFFH